MSRYIDADRYKKDLIQLGFLPALVVSVLDKQPTADVVEVVRCKDCLFAEKGFDEGDVYCKLNDGSFGENAFCSYGERRDECETN